MNELNLFSMAQAAAFRSAHVRNPERVRQFLLRCFRAAGANPASLASMQRF